MRIQKKTGAPAAEGDLTPMIDMTFQLIAFFMVLINFEQSEQNAKIQLPDSELAKPPQEYIEHQIILHLTQRENGQPEMVILGGREYSLETLGPALDQEAEAHKISGAKSREEITVVIRAHKNARAGKVQNLIAKCQDYELRTFALRAKEDVGNATAPS
jgi:biopolymer transport protein ExbD